MRIRSELSINEKFAFYFIYGFYACTNILFWDSNLSATFPAANTLLKLCNYVTLLLLLAFIGIQAIRLGKIRVHSVGWLILSAAFLAASALVLMSIKNSGFLTLALFMMTPFVYKVDLEQLMRFDIKIKIVLLFIIVVLNQAGFIKGIAGVYNQTYKQALGFHQPNALGMFAFVILIEWLYIRFDKLTFKEYIAVFALGFLTMKVSGARTTSYMFFAVFLLFAAVSINPKLFCNKIVQFSSTLAAPLLAVLSVVLTKLFIKKDAFALKMNHVLSDRLDYQAVYWKTYGVKLFGQRIFERDVVVNFEKSSILDCAYIQIILYYGVLFSAIFIFLYSLLLYKAVNRKDLKLALAALFFVGTGFAESSMLRPFLNLTVFALLSYRFGNERAAVKHIKNIILMKLKKYIAIQEQR